MRWKCALALIALPACGDGTLIGSLPDPSAGFEPPSTSDAVFGDWFPCESPACVEVDDDGIRLRSDGAWVGIESDPRTDGYCLTEESGRLRLEPSGSGYLLDIDVPGTDLGGAARLTVDGDGRRAWIEGPDGGVALALIRLELGEAVTPCRGRGTVNNRPQPVPPGAAPRPDG